MAMTKKERAAVDAVINELKLKVALRWTDEVKPDVPPPTSSSNGMTYGWHPSHDRAEAACSTSWQHSIGGSLKEARSQQPLALYSTRRLALLGLRHLMVRRFASDLKRIDDWIEQEEKEPTPLPK